MDAMVIPRPPDTAQDGVAATCARRVDLAITGMSCASCASRVERVLMRSDGVLSVSVNLATEQARVSLDSGFAESEDALAERLEEAVASAGYTAAMLREDPHAASRHASAARSHEGLHLVVAATLAAPLLLSMLLHGWFLLLRQDRLAVVVMLPGWVQFLLATPVQFWIGARFYRAGWAALRARVGSMDQLVAIGSTAAWGLSTIELLRGASNLYYESSALIITFILFGKWLERGARRQAASSVQSLAFLRPERVLRSSAGIEQEMALDELRVGDHFVVRAGMRIPADGVVRDGQSGIDEALITGESRAVEKGRGDRVIAGSLATDGRLLIETTAIGAQTRLAGIVRAIETAQASRAPVQRLVDRISAVFVPIVLLLAALTFVFWWSHTGHFPTALLSAVSVLVIACPCALGLATPAALVTGIGAAARAGILIRDAAAIERARGVGTVAFDKTGTLTEGRPMLEQVIPASGATQYAEAAELLSLAAAMQAGSEHPLAAAVRNASGHSVTRNAERFATVPGRGVAATVGGRSLLLGNLRLIELEGLSLSPELAEAAAQIDEDGGTVSLLAERRPSRGAGGKILGLLGFSDQLRPGAAEAVALLSKRGIGTVMLTGDGEGAARKIAHEAGIDRLLAAMSPEQKADAIRQLARELRGTAHPRIAMVGDGINDAPALAAADLGIAMAGGTDAAIEAAGITLMRNDPRLVSGAIEIAALIGVRIRQGLFWAFIYNLIGIPLAASGLLSPAIAGAAMALSSVSVVLNALRLKGWQPSADPALERAA